MTKRVVVRPRRTFDREDPDERRPSHRSGPQSRAPTPAHGLCSPDLHSANMSRQWNRANGPCIDIVRRGVNDRARGLAHVSGEAVRLAIERHRRYPR
jgi:hypothetical protein